VPQLLICTEPSDGIGSAAAIPAQDGWLGSEHSSKRENGDIVVGNGLLASDQLQHVIDGRPKARRDRLAEIDQHYHV
jgi:hypothetical protein